MKSGIMVQKVKSDAATGQYEFPVLPGTYEINVVTSGYIPTGWHGPVSADMKVDFSMVLAPETKLNITIDVTCYNNGDNVGYLLADIGRSLQRRQQHQGYCSGRERNAEAVARRITDDRRFVHQLALEVSLDQFGNRYEPRRARTLSQVTAFAQSVCGASCILAAQLSHFLMSIKTRLDPISYQSVKWSLTDT